MAAYWPEVFHSEALRNALVLQYIGSGARSGNQDFRHCISEMARDFLPTIVVSNISGPIDGEDMMLFVNENAEKSVQGARIFILKAHEYRKIYTKLPSAESSGAHELKRFTTTIKELANKFGLRPTADVDDWWGYTYLHYLVSHEMRSLTQYGYSALERGLLTLRSFSSYGYSKEFTIKWERGEESERKASEQHVLQQFRQQWAESGKELKKHGFSPLGMRYPDVHIHWLYCRICPQPPFGRPWGWTYLSNREHYSVRECSRVVKELARLLEIALPKLPEGRPRSSPRNK